ncbi:MAG: HAD hydrolase-like protein [Patescibacteria group bacterium]|nr:HAD hydrolase-like protein [Patescibacteria group bacterium]
MRIVFDFDHTLFSAKRLYEGLKEEFRKLGVNENLFQETFERSKGKGRDYKPFQQFKLINKENPQIEIKTLKKSFEKVFKKAPKFLYKDAIWFLKKWKNKADLILLSYGEEKFQRQKIEKSKIKKYFKKIIITRDIEKTKPFKKAFQKNKKIIFVEDNPEALFKIKENYPKVIAIRINRKEGKYWQEKNNSKIDFSIRNLRELEKILN